MCMYIIFNHTLPLLLPLHITRIPITFPDTDRPLLHRYSEATFDLSDRFLRKKKIKNRQTLFTLSASRRVLLLSSCGYFLFVVSPSFWIIAYSVYLRNNNNNNMYNSVYDMIIINWRACRPERGRFRWPPGTDVRACKRLYFYYYFSYVFPVLLLCPLCVRCLSPIRVAVIN